MTTHDGRTAGSGKRVVCVLALLCWFSTASAAEPHLHECRRAAGKITLDGHADEDAWSAAATLDKFTLPWQRDNRPAKTKTSAKLLWDDEYLYFHAQLEDRDLYADVTEQDGITWENDVFELFFKPSDKDPGYYEFQANAAGTKMDMFLPSRGSGGYKRWKSAHEFNWEVNVTLDGTLNKYTDKDEGWQVEGRFPWKDFSHTGGRPAAGDVWKFTLCRYDYSVEFESQELSTIAPLQVGSFHRYEDYARLKFVK